MVMSKSTEELHDKIRDPFYAVAYMSTGTAPDEGDDYLITKKAFNEYAEGLVQLILTDKQAAIREARIDEVERFVRSSDMAGIPLFNGNGRLYAKDRIASLNQPTKEGIDE